jgi:hypothetical protein
MQTTSARFARRRPRWARVRRVFAGQVALWDRALDDLEPWRQEGPLRWRGGSLDGAKLAEAEQAPGR